jgi:hypothetical protein
MWKCKYRLGGDWWNSEVIWLKYERCTKNSVGLGCNRWGCVYLTNVNCHDEACCDCRVWGELVNYGECVCSYGGRITWIK